ncbi:MAG: sphingosine N-acyltransferase lag1 [Candelina mexicana]|nr:MAG: sphingosine N-acyltransferase lag1 [Candelina mexicana]
MSPESEHERAASINDISDISCCANPSAIDDKGRRCGRRNPRGVRRRDDSTVSVCCAWVVEHQIGLATNLLLLLGLTHLCFPRARRQTRKFFELSYYNSDSGGYAIGWDDLFMVLYWIVVFTGMRAAVIDYVLMPLAQWGGVEKKKNRIRFAEQAWLLLYYVPFWTLGMSIMYSSEYWLNLKELWTGWPNREMGGICKWYYLVQFAFWLQQILVVNIEERRKDYHQMFTHHIITCALVFASYGYHQTKVGTMILCIMDVVDLVFPLAKILNYLHFRLACDVAFGVFMVTWFAARHIVYLMVCWSVYKDIPEVMHYGCYSGKKGQIIGPFSAPKTLDHLTQPFRRPDGIICWDNQIKWAFLFLLLVLQVITIIWFGMIVRVAWKVIKGGTAEDSRSDDEGEDGSEHEDMDMKRTPQVLDFAPLEEEVGVESIHLKGRTSPTRRFRKSNGSASGVMLPGHSDRKELLGRIGCDKGA